MRPRRLFLLGAALLALAPGSASAHGWLGNGYSVAWVGWWPAPRMSTQDYIPYFAKHPPVYYSRPIARPYGYVPYSYFPETPASQAVVAPPAVVRNHYVAEDASLSSVEAPSPAPLKIINPFATGFDDPMPVPDETPFAEPEA